MLFPLPIIIGLFLILGIILVLQRHANIDAMIFDAERRLLDDKNLQINHVISTFKTHRNQI